jgi:hypothetical protein
MMGESISLFFFFSSFFLFFVFCCVICRIVRVLFLLALFVVSFFLSVFLFSAQVLRLIDRRRDKPLVSTNLCLLPMY